MFYNKLYGEVIHWQIKNENIACHTIIHPEVKLKTYLVLNLGLMRLLFFLSELCICRTIFISTVLIRAGIFSACTKKWRRIKEAANMTQGESIIMNADKFIIIISFIIIFEKRALKI